jgi:asparagine synthase (glutamine-hydrolysing)
MCGIVGIVHRDRRRPVAVASIHDMCAAIASRGPDDEGIHVAGGVGLGMRRLSIIDLAGGNQPIFNEDGSKVIVFNGEIYNYQELRRDLIARGHEFRSHSDTEAVLHLYEDEGVRCLDRLRGMFAFAIWDSREQTLFLARDRFGIKPLYVTAGAWGLGFASELKAILAGGLSNRALDWEALDAYFQLGYIPAPATPFTDVKKLEPGHYLTWSPTGAIKVERYWDLPTAAVPAPPNIERQIVEWLDDSVAAHLVSDVPVAAFLSGGLDSSAVVASMAMLGQSPHAFTARYLGSGAAAANEGHLAQQLANRYGAKLTVVDIEPDIRDVVEPIVRALDEPHADDSAIPTWMLSQAVGASYKVALTGIGGDELFAGYRRHIGVLLGQHYARLPLGLQQVVSGVANRLREPAGGDLSIDRLKRFVRPGRNGTAHRFFSFLRRVDDHDRNALYSTGVSERVASASTLRRFQDVYERGGALKGLRAGLYLDYKTFLPDDILALSDRLSMAHSLEIRVPLVDHVLIERVFGLPDHVKIGWWRKKQLLKRALRPRLPSGHLSAPKRGFVGPTSSWLRNELRDVLGDELSSDRLRRLGYFDAGTVTRFFDDHLTRRRNREGILWALLSFSIWHRLYVEDAPSPSYGVR